MSSPFIHKASARTISISGGGSQSAGGDRRGLERDPAGTGRVLRRNERSPQAGMEWLLLQPRHYDSLEPSTHGSPPQTQTTSPDVRLSGCVCEWRWLTDGRGGGGGEGGVGNPYTHLSVPPDANIPQSAGDLPCPNADPQFLQMLCRSAVDCAEDDPPAGRSCPQSTDQI